MVDFYTAIELIRRNGGFKPNKREDYPLAELNQCIFNPAYRFVVNVIDVL